MASRSVSAALVTFFALTLFPPAVQAGRDGKNFDDYTAAERDEAKALARTQKFARLRVCADPGNLPFSDDKGNGYANRIAELLARSMKAKLEYFYRPYLERGITRQTFNDNECDLLMDMPSKYDPLLTTDPIYRTTYVLATRAADKLTFSGFDDPKLRELKIGTYQLSAVREALFRRGISTNVTVHVVSHDADLSPDKQPWRQVQQVVDGTLDIAGVWGPFAGYLKAKRGVALDLQPVNLWDDDIPMEFDLAIGMRKTDAVLKYAIENALEDNKAEVEAILREFGVPLVQCSDCIVAGDLPAHGVYNRPRETAQGKRRQEVTQARLDEWLSQGADLTEELGNAVMAHDAGRVAVLLDRGADPNALSLEGSTPLHRAARDRDGAMMTLLLDRGAQVDRLDRDGWTPLLQSVLRNDAAGLTLLAARGANLQARTPTGFTALTLAADEGKFEAAHALIGLGADVNATSGKERLTALMVTATKLPSSQRAHHINQKYSPVDIGRALIAKGAEVNAVNHEGVSALMIAAARDNSPLIGLLAQSGADMNAKSKFGQTAAAIAERNDNVAAVRMLKVLQSSAGQ
ncbi:quinoprotein dehydrogenase-associated probable ABC transporter substrate-binding protein [Methylorubrum rhodinum]|uniref:Quinoprotein dehydrogenase-associated probable ABC transporter substrate-binding protein n=1 Tax=Methylorubrum rhodinum TaxID=29428 RepID=A0A840ZKE9_9HYPH|nr:quinoprotein dehydrogenase-associated putative ABC transporter substrate-binding protein [Methylorubrum rhodinum]MBB5757624.1 quinoprotein dehydrogenase-associated probable ABC transporter substrate-binding protein [Methylorubrum rhodinum]